MSSSSSSLETVNKVVLVLAISASAYLAGFTSSASILTLPVLPLSGPFTAVRQWSALFHKGFALGPPMGLTSLGLFAYSAWAAGALGGEKKGLMLALAGVFAAANMPWTIFTMLPTNTALLKFAEESERKSREVQEDAQASRKREGEVKVLLSRWSRLNAARSVWPTLGALLGGAAAVGLF